MALSTLVKISGVNNLSDARYCAGMGAGILGFCPEPDHPDYVDLKKFKEITGWVKGVKLAGEFYNSSPDKIFQIDREYSFDYLQVNKAGMVTPVSASGKSLVFNLDLSEYSSNAEILDTLNHLSPKIVYFLIEGQHQDPGLIQQVCQWSNNYPILLGAGVDPGNIISMITKYKISGFAFKGSREIKPGYGDFAELADIFESLELEN